jgi:hypothetical protein
MVPGIKEDIKDLEEILSHVDYAKVEAPIE